MKSSGFADILEANKVYKPTVIEGICFAYINYKNTITFTKLTVAKKSNFRTFLISSNIFLNNLFYLFTK